MITKFIIIPEINLNDYETQLYNPMALPAVSSSTLSGMKSKPATNPCPNLTTPVLGRENNYAFRIFQNSKSVRSGRSAKSIATGR